jgi:hypothetical protein
MQVDEKLSIAHMIKRICLSIIITRLRYKVQTSGPFLRIHAPSSSLQELIEETRDKRLQMIKVLLFSFIDFCSDR